MVPMGLAWGIPPSSRAQARLSRRRAYPYRHLVRSHAQDQPHGVCTHLTIFRLTSPPTLTRPEPPRMRQTSPQVRSADSLIRSLASRIMPVMAMSTAPRLRTLAARSSRPPYPVAALAPSSVWRDSRSDPAAAPCLDRGHLPVSACPVRGGQYRTES